MRKHLLLQDVLAEDNWADMLTAEDRRGLTPLFWQHVLPYGEVKLDMTARLSIRTTPPKDPPASPSKARRGIPCGTMRARPSCGLGRRRRGSACGTCLLGQAH